MSNNKNTILIKLGLRISLVTIAMLAVSSFAHAAKPGPLRFVPGVPNKTGCLVCHGDAKILKTKSKEKRNLYVSEAIVFDSAHKELACVDCHKDFTRFIATKEHDADIANYKIVARDACENCHDHLKQLQQLNMSVHGKTARGPTCFDCHGSHNIKSFKKDELFREQFRFASAKICGKCHQKYADSYNDYYHGKAYNQMAKDAPVCWDCHGTHDVQPKINLASNISEARLAKTCEKCHADVRTEFAKRYSKMIHGSKKVRSDNFVIGIFEKAIAWLRRL